MLAQPRQIHHEGVFELAVDVLLDAFEIDVLRALGKLGAENLFPVRAPFDLFHALAGDQRTRASRRRCLQLWRRLQVLVVEREGLVVVVDFRQVRIGENVRQHAPLRADARLDLAVLLAPPAAVPAVLVFPVLRIADAGLGLDVVEPGVFHPFAIGPDILAGDRARVAPDALVEVQHHRDLSADFHSAASILGATGRGSG